MRLGRPLLGPLRERDFRLFFLGQSISRLGSGMVSVALAFAVLDLTGSVSDLGFVLGVQTLAQVAFLLAGGVVGDRLSRRGVMVASDLVSCASQAATAALLIAGEAHLWHLMVLQSASGSAACGSASGTASASGSNSAFSWHRSWRCSRCGYRRSPTPRSPSSAA
jgi:MFS family permease